MCHPDHLAGLISDDVRAGAISPYTDAQIRCASLFLNPISLALEHGRGSASLIISRAILQVRSGLVVACVPEAEAMAVADLLCEVFDVPPLSCLDLA